nr:MAG TPA: hypothetical protein [Caudoviricetes sp.]
MSMKAATWFPMPCGGLRGSVRLMHRVLSLFWRERHGRVEFAWFRMIPTVTPCETFGWRSLRVS